MTYYELVNEHGGIVDIEYIYGDGPATHAVVTYDDGFEYKMTIDAFEKDLEDTLTNTSDEDIQKEIEKYKASSLPYDLPPNCPWDCGAIAEHFMQDGYWEQAIANYLQVCWDIYDEEDDEEEWSE